MLLKTLNTDTSPCKLPDSWRSSMIQKRHSIPNRFFFTFMEVFWTNIKVFDLFHPIWTGLHPVLLYDIISWSEIANPNSFSAIVWTPKCSTRSWRHLIWNFFNLNIPTNRNTKSTLPYDKKKSFKLNSLLTSEVSQPALDMFFYEADGKKTFYAKNVCILKWREHVFGVEHMSCCFIFWIRKKCLKFTNKIEVAILICTLLKKGTRRLQSLDIFLTHVFRIQNTRHTYVQYKKTCNLPLSNNQTFCLSYRTNNTGYCSYSFDHFHPLTSNISHNCILS